jgi:hypothetical protein
MFNLLKDREELWEFIAIKRLDGMLLTNRLVARGQRGGKKESFFIHTKAFGGSIAGLYDRKKAQCGKKRAFLTPR